MAGKYAERTEKLGVSDEQKSEAARLAMKKKKTKRDVIRNATRAAAAGATSGRQAAKTEEER